MSNIFHTNLTLDDIHALNARTYADITARDADTAFQITTNINKMVRVDSPASYFILTSLSPTVWSEASSTGTDTLAEVLVGGNITGGTDLIISVGDDLFVSDHMTVGAAVAPPASVSIDLAATNAALLLNRLTTTQRDALTPISGMHIYNTTVSDVEYFNGVSWVSMGGGDVTGPVSATDNALVRFNGTGGKNVQNSVGILNDAGILASIIGLGVGIAIPNDTAHILVNGTSGYTGAIDRGLLITKSEGPRLTFEEPGGIAGEKIIAWRYENGILAALATTDSGNLVDVDNIFTINRDGPVALRGLPSATSQFRVNTALTEAIRLSGNNTDSVHLSLHASAAGGDEWQLVSTANANTIGGGHLRVFNVDTSSSFAFLNTGNFDLGGVDSAYEIGGTVVLATSPTAFNTLVGLNAGIALTTGLFNTAVGFGALLITDTGSSNTAVGRLAMQANISGGNNSAFGRDAMDQNTTGSRNSAFGDGVLSQNVIGFDNAAFGAEALSQFTAAGASAFGSKALRLLISGTGSVAIGDNAGTFIADGFSPNAVSGDGVYIGSFAKALVSGGVNEIAIGATATGLGSNTVVLGNDSIITTALKGNVGIGTTAPAALLQIGLDNNGDLLNLNSERAWIFGASGSGGSTALTLRPDVTGLKNFNIITQDELASVASFGADNTLSNIKIRLVPDGGSVTIGTEFPSNLSAILDVKSTTLGSLSAPRVTTVQKDAIASPATALSVFDTDIGRYGFFDGTKWKGMEEGPLNVVYFTDASQLPAPSGGIITLDENTTYVMYNDDPTTSQKQVIFTDRLQIPDAGGVRITSIGLATALLVYTGTGTFITTSSTFTGFLHIDELFLSAPNGTLFNIDGVLPISSEFFPRIFLSGMGFFNTDTLGTIKTISVNMDVGAFFDCGQGLVLDGIEEALIDNWRFTNWKNEVGAVFLTFKNTLRFPKINGCTFETAANETAFDIGPFIGSETFILAGNSYRGDGALYATGVSGTVTAVIDVTHSGTIDSVAGTAFGESIFTDPAHGLDEGEIITQSGFVTATQYNGTFEVLEIIDANSYRLHVAFTVTDTGSWTSPRIQFAAVNSLAVGDGVQITGTTDYDDEYRILGVSGIAFFMNGVFVSSQSGAFNTDSLTESDPIMRVVGNAGMPDSRVIGSFFDTGNTAVTTISAANTFTDLNLTGAGASNLQRWIVSSTVTGELEYTGVEDFSGTLVASIFASIVSGEIAYNFRVVKNGVVMADVIEAPVNLKDNGATAVLVAPIDVITGDVIRLQVENTFNTINLTIENISVSIQ